MQLLCESINAKQCPSADDLAPLSGRVKALAQVFDQVSLRDSVLIIRRHDDPERELIIVSNALGERLIRFYHEGPGGAHQVPKATSAKLIRLFWWPDFKRDVRLYIACSPTCEKFIRLVRTPKAGLRPMSIGERGDCIAIDISGCKDSLPLTPKNTNCCRNLAFEANNAPVLRPSTNSCNG